MLFYSNLIEGCVSSFIITFSTTMGATKESNYGFGTLLLHNKSAVNSAGEGPGVYGKRSMTRFYYCYYCCYYFLVAERSVALERVRFGILAHPRHKSQ